MSAESALVALLARLPGHESQRCVWCGWPTRDGREACSYCDDVEALWLAHVDADPAGFVRS